MARTCRRIRTGTGRIVSALYTVGHGTLTGEALTDLLHQTKIEAVVDVRRFPGSRRHPQFAREAMQQWLPGSGVAYRWEEALGGRRRVVPGSPNIALRNPAFRAYADYMASEPFRDAFALLLKGAAVRPTAVMCSESLWWRCHRRLIADAASLLNGVDVWHLLHNRRFVPHVPTEGVRVEGSGLVYDAGEARLL